MSVSSYARIEVSYPKGTSVDEEISAFLNPYEYGDLVCIDQEVMDTYVYGLLDDYVRLFGRPLTEVEGLKMSVWYREYDEYWEFELIIEDGKLTYSESVVRMVEMPASACPVKLG